MRFMGINPTLIVLASLLNPKIFFFHSKIIEEGNDQELIQSDPEHRPHYTKGKKSQHEVTSVNK